MAFKGEVVRASRAGGYPGGVKRPPPHVKARVDEVNVHGVNPESPPLKRTHYSPVSVVCHVHMLAQQNAYTDVLSYSNHSYI